ncbi:helix-turn-helix domain-containing protein [Pseudoalteromonas luteoviolacea]|uniref:helix-turn-helix domain-containing protein n=1 Tax=Pseudoalteromonas luteoviolacea TaxID=43657 RepID=UPI00115221C7|nr:helix-turn-helix domain-containing protein [Pseudoalteromonas luteoviolacea]TQF72309.1 helix-turn-helix transcriptional regulator [Pseudoalteromonas luteoviolacea]
MHIQPGIFAVYTRVIDTAPHRHHQIQLTLPNESCTLYCEQGILNGAHIIPSNCPHQLKMDKGWVILIEPHSDMGQQLNQNYCSNQANLLHDEILQVDHNTPLSTLMDVLRLDYSKQYTALDPRIALIVAQLDNSFKHATLLEPKHWRACKIAAQTHLSESRFLHLFREEMGIAWRPYLLWKRLICAIGYLRQQQNITVAATHAGFSDSAHFSRSFKKQFGISPKEALQRVER